MPYLVSRKRGDLIIKDSKSLKKWRFVAFDQVKFEGKTQVVDFLENRTKYGGFEQLDSGNLLLSLQDNKCLILHPFNNDKETMILRHLKILNKKVSFQNDDAINELYNDMMKCFALVFACMLILRFI